MSDHAKANPTLDDRLWSEDQAIEWLTQDARPEDAKGDEVARGQAATRHVLRGEPKPTTEDRANLLIERRGMYFDDPLAALPLVWVWLASSATPRKHMTRTAHRVLSAWILSKLEEGYVPCLKFKSEKAFRYAGGHNGYPIFDLVYLPFMYRHPGATGDDWEVTFTRIRPDAPHRDPLQTKPQKKRQGDASGCDRFVSGELRKMAKDGSGHVIRLGASRETQRKYRLALNRATLAETLAKASAKTRRAYSESTIQKSLSKFAISPKGPAA